MLKKCSTKVLNIPRASVKLPNRQYGDDNLNIKIRGEMCFRSNSFPYTQGRIRGRDKGGTAPPPPTKFVVG